MRPNVVSIFHCLKETKAYFQEIKETNENQTRLKITELEGNAMNLSMSDTIQT